ncbi:MAG: DsrE family protein [Rhodothermaceae bacterium]
MKILKTAIFTLLFFTCLFAQSHSTEKKVDGVSSATDKTHKVDGVSSASEMVVEKKYQRLAVLWTTDNKEVFTKVVFPYVLNSKKMNWWDEVTLIVWGPSSKLLGSDKELQELIGKLREEGIILTACKWCSDEYKVSEILADLNIDVKYMGKPLTEFLQNDSKVITF